VLAAGLCACFAAGVDPLSPIVEPTKAAPITPIVAILIRRGVSQVAWLF
jgi:hypothetical protein